MGPPARLHITRCSAGSGRVALLCDASGRVPSQCCIGDVEPWTAARNVVLSSWQRRRGLMGPPARLHITRCEVGCYLSKERLRSQHAHANVGANHLITCVVKEEREERAQHCRKDDKGLSKRAHTFAPVAVAVWHCCAMRLAACLRSAASVMWSHGQRRGTPPFRPGSVGEA